jgi:glyoxylase-like metal-dependent hydrolase (beta-lactamase superfamily II)
MNEKVRLRIAIMLAALCAAPALAAAAGAASDPQQVLSDATKALGSEGLHSIEFSGSGSDFVLGQAPTVNSPWPRFNDTSYTRVVAFDPWATQLQRTRTQAENPPRGGGQQPIVGEQKQLQVVAAGSADAAALPDDMALTLPQAFLKEAAEATDVVATVEVKGGVKRTVIAFTARNHARTRGWINDAGMVEHVETTIDNTVLGDMPYSVEFTDYKDFDGLKFPTHIVQSQGGYPVLDLTVSAVKANVPTDFKAAPAAPPAPMLASEALGDGAWLITGGYAALAVDFKDHILIIEGGTSDKRSEAVIAEAQRLIPGKPITEMVNTHGHFDHLGGVRDYVAHGVTIITYATNKPYYEKIWANPHTLVPDALSHSPHKAKFKLVHEHLKLTDGDQVVELYHMQDFGHSDAMLLAYLPKQKILVEADGFNPPPMAITKTLSSVSPYQLSLEANIKRLNLDVQRIIPIHLPADGRKVQMSEFLTAIGQQ